MKNFIIKIILHFLYKGIKVLNGRDSVITSEIKAIPNNYKIKIETDLKKPLVLCIQIKDRKVIKISNDGNFDLVIRLKNSDLAFKVFTGQLSISTAYAEHYFQLFGNIYQAMGVTRILERVEGYLFPKFINKKCVKKPFRREISMLKTYLLCIF
ncbi:MAG: hypothetical protein E7376_00030 [Clostridiales bacterium]|nr:hypothetical protein [Clostridiales bacterium]